MPSQSYTYNPDHGCQIPAREFSSSSSPFAQWFLTIRKVGLQKCLSLQPRFSQHSSFKNTYFFPRTSMSAHVHKTKCSLCFVFFSKWESDQACVTSIFKSADLLRKQKSLQESKDRLKDLPVLEILPTTPSYKCILQPSSKPKRNIFLEVLAADSCKWNYFHSRMQTNLLTWGAHMGS